MNTISFETISKTDYEKIESTLSENNIKNTQIALLELLVNQGFSTFVYGDIEKITNSIKKYYDNPTPKNLYALITNIPPMQIDLIDKLFKQLDENKENIKWNKYEQDNLKEIGEIIITKHPGFIVPETITTYIVENDIHQKYYYLKRLENIRDKKELLETYRKIRRRLFVANSQEVFERLIKLFDTYIPERNKHEQHSYNRILKHIGLQPEQNTQNKEIYKNEKDYIDLFEKIGKNDNFWEIYRKHSTTIFDINSQELYEKLIELFDTYIPERTRWQKRSYNRILLHMTEDVPHTNRITDIPHTNRKESTFYSIKNTNDEGYIPENIIGEDIKKRLRIIYRKMKDITFIEGGLTNEQKAIIKNLKNRGKKNKWYYVGVGKIYKLNIRYLKPEYVIELIKNMYKNDIDDLLEYLENDYKKGAI